MLAGTLAAAGLLVSGLGPSTGQGASSAHDGTYAVSMEGNRWITGAVTYKLNVTNGNGLLAISKAGCADSKFDLTISPAGDISGQGDLKCFVGDLSFTVGRAHHMSGPIDIGGRIADKKATLQLRSRMGSDFSVVLPQTAN